MNDKKWIDLGMKYGGFMAQDQIFLENRLATLTDVADKRLLVTPPASVLNAYFAELYHQQYLYKNPNGYCGLGGCGIKFN